MWCELADSSRRASIPPSEDQMRSVMEESPRHSHTPPLRDAIWNVQPESPNRAYTLPLGDESLKRSNTLLLSNQTCSVLPESPKRAKIPPSGDPWSILLESPTRDLGNRLWCVLPESPNRADSPLLVDPRSFNSNQSSNTVADDDFLCHSPSFDVGIDITLSPSAYRIDVSDSEYWWENQFPPGDETVRAVHALRQQWKEEDEKLEQEKLAEQLRKEEEARRQVEHEETVKRQEALYRIIQWLTGPVPSKAPTRRERMASSTDDGDDSRRSGSSPEDDEYDHKRANIPYWMLAVLWLINDFEQAHPVSTAYDFISVNFPHARNHNENWKNALRHNLTKKPFFEKFDGAGDSEKKRVKWLININDESAMRKLQKMIFHFRRKQKDISKYGLANIDDWQQICEAKKGLPTVKEVAAARIRDGEKLMKMDEMNYSRMTYEGPMENFTAEAYNAYNQAYQENQYPPAYYGPEQQPPTSYYEGHNGSFPYYQNDQEQLYPLRVATWPNARMHPYSPPCQEKTGSSTKMARNHKQTPYDSMHSFEDGILDRESPSWSASHSCLPNQPGRRALVNPADIHL